MKKWIAIVAAVLTCGCLSWFVLEVRATPQDELPLAAEPLEDPQPLFLDLDAPRAENSLGTETELPHADPVHNERISVPSREGFDSNGFLTPATPAEGFLPPMQNMPGRDAAATLNKSGLGSRRGRNQPFAHPTDPRAVALGKIRYLKQQLATGGGDRDKLEDLLKSALNDYFQADMQRREAELDAIRKRLAAMEAKLKKRSDLQKKIVDLQLTLLLHEADGLGFFAPGHGPQSNNQTFPIDPVNLSPNDDEVRIDRQQLVPSDAARFPDNIWRPVPMDNPRSLLDNPVPQRVPSDAEPLRRDDLGFSSS